MTTTHSSTNNESNLLSTGYLNATSAYQLDQDLMAQGEPGFCLEQLMELAGLSVAEAVYHILQDTRTWACTGTSHSSAATSFPRDPHVLVVCGPGNNGGDGLVAARHLRMFGIHATVLYPTRDSSTQKQPHYARLVHQCRAVGVAVVNSETELTVPLQDYDAIVDAIFGFSFSGALREPFQTILPRLVQVQQQVPIVAVDVPSGWNVNDGDVTQLGFMPMALVSLTAPKESAKYFTGRHFVGGRFLPHALAQKYHIAMPDYPGVAQVVEVTNNHQQHGTNDGGQGQCDGPP